MVEAKAPSRLSFEEFLKWLDEDTWAEWVDGGIVMLSPASKRHQDIRGFLEALLTIYAQERNLGVVLGAPFLVRLPGEIKRGREPDLLFVAKENLGRLKETYLDGPADLVIEIVSPDSRLRDRGEKFAEYEMGGIKEYWLIDPEERRADFYVLGADGRYARRLPNAQGIFQSEVMAGLWMRTDWLWQEPLPPVLEVLRELKLI